MEPNDFSMLATVARSSLCFASIGANTSFAWTTPLVMITGGPLGAWNAGIHGLRSATYANVAATAATAAKTIFFRRDVDGPECSMAGDYKSLACFRNKIKLRKVAASFTKPKNGGLL